MTNNSPLCISNNKYRGGDQRPRELSLHIGSSGTDPQQIEILGIFLALLRKNKNLFSLLFFHWSSSLSLYFRSLNLLFVFVLCFSIKHITPASFYNYHFCPISNYRGCGRYLGLVSGATRGDKGRVPGRELWVRDWMDKYIQNQNPFRRAAQFPICSWSHTILCQGWITADIQSTPPPITSAKHCSKEWIISLYSS